MENKLLADVLEPRLNEPTYQGRISQVQEYLREKNLKEWSRGSINAVLRNPTGITISKKNKELVEAVVYLSRLHGWEVGSFKKLNNGE